MKGDKKFMTFRFNSVLIRFLTLLFIFLNLGLQTTPLSHDHMTKTMMAQTYCHVILLLFFSVSEPIPNLRYHSPVPLPSPHFHIEKMSPYKVLKWKYV